MTRGVARWPLAVPAVACTHPLLTAVARHVNDHTSDAGRQRLADLIPSVIRAWLARNRTLCCS